jgi:glutaredoxin
MNRIEKAINYLIDQNNEANCYCGYSKHYDKETLEMFEINDIAIKTLREKQQRNNGCQWCKENKSLYFDSKNNHPNLREVYIEDDGNMTVMPYLYDGTEAVQIKINYCPMCGRELK